MQLATSGQAFESIPTFSIVICTDGRAQALRNTLCSLSYLEYPSFEVCVVHGPTEDGTRELLEEYAGRIKVAYNPERNLSVSRNIGIAMAAGEIVAFIDDDCIPEPEWIRDLAAAFADPAVGGVGGFVYNHLGIDFQCRYSTGNRLGRDKNDWPGPVDQMSFPLTANFPHLRGANSSFRRAALLSVGGFDEEYEYFLDETDVILRLIDANWLLRIIEGAYVHHQFLSSSIRRVEREHRVLSYWYPIVKNKLYFCLRHALGPFSFNHVIDDTRSFIDELARDMDWAVGAGFLDGQDRQRFWLEVDQAWHDGLQQGLRETTPLMAQETLATWASAFLPFAAATPAGGRRTFCFVTQEYTLGQMGGIGRYTHELAERIATMEHHVHVITKGDQHDYVAFDHGVWVHHITNKVADAPQPAGLHIPAFLWDRATTVTHTLAGIAAKRSITAVCAPIWDCEGIAAVAQGRYPVVTTLQTSMAPFLASNPSRTVDPVFVQEYAEPVIEAEKWVMRESHRVIGCSQAIVEEMEHLYDIRFDPQRLTFIPYGMGDWSGLPREMPAALPAGSMRLLFVGRLEERKGIDVLLSCAKRILARHPNVYLDIVGNDQIPGPTGRTFKQEFKADPDAQALRSRVLFHGAVSDEQLRGFYEACDVVVAPSRFESFGLMLVEAMMFGKPVIACKTGGMPEVVEDGVTGLLAEPGDEFSLETCIERLVEDAERRTQMGAAGRQRYETRFHVGRIAEAMVASFIDAANSTVLPAPNQHAEPSPTNLKLVETAMIVAGGTATGGDDRARRRVVIIAPMLAKYDAISTAVRDSYRMLAADQRLDVLVLTYRNDFPDVRAQTISGVDELLLHPAFLAADLILYHFGIFSDLFNALICGNGHAQQIVRFHNITPLQLVTPAQEPLVRESFRQVTNLLYADAIWADSQVNQEVLEEYGISGDRITVLPLVVDEPAFVPTWKKSSAQLEMLYVGRCVPSKGLLDLVQAVNLALHHAPVPLRLRIAGSEEWSDQQYLQTVKLYVRQHQLEEIIEFCGAVDDRRRETLYHEAHILAIPSYHEGFCKPAIEALRSGCVPVGYASYNLPAITHGLGRLVAPGDIAALAIALAEVVTGLARASAEPHRPLLPLDRGATTLHEFDAIRGAYVRQFTLEHLATQTLERTHALLACPTTPLPATEESDEALSSCKTEYYAHSTMIHKNNSIVW